MDGEKTENRRATEQSISELRWRDEPNVTTAVVAPSLKGPASLRANVTDNLAQLEAENAELRHRAVELALQIQALAERLA